MSLNSVAVTKRAGSANSAAYDDVATGIEYATEFADQGYLADDRSVDRDGGDTNLRGVLAKKKMDRHSDVSASKELYSIGKGTSTKKGKVTEPVLKLDAEGIHSKSRQVPAARRAKGITDSDADLFHFNHVAGRRSENNLSVGRDDRMSPKEAKDKLLGIATMLGVENESSEYLYTFVHALLVTHALNGASLVGPGRATFYVDNDEFHYGDVLKFLGSDSRRFYRAYADETAKALIAVLEGYDPGKSNSVRLCGQIRAKAVEKKLTQFPYLIHDSADACYRTSVTEMAAVARSKQYVLRNGDSLNPIEELESSVDA